MECARVGVTGNVKERSMSMDGIREARLEEEDILRWAKESALARNMGEVMSTPRPKEGVERGAETG